MSTQHIPRSRRKLVLILLGALLLLAASIFVIVVANQRRDDWSRIPAMIIGAAGLLLFSGGFVVLVKLLLDPSPGLFIEPDGFTDKTSWSTVGKVYWRDVVGFQKTTIFNNTFLTVALSNPEAYVERSGSGLKKWSLRQNWRSYGSPVQLNLQSLDMGFDELWALLEQEWDGYAER
jgi:hypothetical protein